jgi:hypothetical protein
MNKKFIKLGSNLFVNWDPAELTRLMPEVSNTETNLPFEKDTMAYWERHYTNVTIGRNFYKNFKQVAEEIAEKLVELQLKLKSSIKESNELLDLFLEHNINANRITLFKTVPGENIHIHKDEVGTDVIRVLTINIGLKHSDQWKTYVTSQIKETEFWDSDPESFLMEDGDVYLLRADKLHCAICLDPKRSVESRYLVSYTMLMSTEKSLN